MKFIVLGAGEVGTSVCRRLASEHHDVVLIERHESQINKIVSSLDVQIIIGDGCTPEILNKAGIKNADYLIAVASEDAVNVTACFFASLLNSGVKRIARVRDLNVLHKDVDKSRLKKAFDLIINPDQAAADFVLHSFKVPGAKELLEFCDGRVRFLGLSISSDAPLLKEKNRMLKDFQDKDRVLFLGVLRGESFLIPKTTDELRPGDILYAALEPAQTDFLFQTAGQIRSEGKRAMIWGGTSLGMMVAAKLEAQGVQTKLIISDPEKAAELVDALRKTMILAGDGTDQNLLIEENVGDFDAFIGATPDDEDNILSCLLAKRLGAHTVMSVVDKPTYLQLVSAIGIDTVVSPRQSAATAVFAHIHSKSLLSEFALRHLGAGLVEIYATEDMAFIGDQLSDLRLPSGIMVAAVERNGSVIIPRGSDSIQINDRVVFFVISSALSRLEKLLNIRLELLDGLKTPH